MGRVNAFRHTFAAGDFDVEPPYPRLGAVAIDHDHKPELRVNTLGTAGAHGRHMAVPRNSFREVPYVFDDPVPLVIGAVVRLQVTMAEAMGPRSRRTLVALRVSNAAHEAAIDGVEDRFVPVDWFGTNRPRPSSIYPDSHFPPQPGKTHLVGATPAPGTAAWLPDALVSVDLVEGNAVVYVGGQRVNDGLAVPADGVPHEIEVSISATGFLTLRVDDQTRRTPGAPLGYATVQAVSVFGPSTVTIVDIGGGNFLPVADGVVLWHFVDVELVTAPTPALEDGCLDELDPECLAVLAQDAQALLDHYRGAASAWEAHAGRRFDQRLPELLLAVGDVLRGKPPSVEGVAELVTDLEQSGFQVRPPAEVGQIPEACQETADAIAEILRRDPTWGPIVQYLAELEEALASGAKS